MVATASVIFSFTYLRHWRQQRISSSFSKFSKHVHILLLLEGMHGLLLLEGTASSWWHRLLLFPYSRVFSEF